MILAHLKNWIPLAFAEVLADRLDLDVEVGIAQREKIKRTGTGSDYRLAFNPTFIGNVKEGQSYLIVDDILIGRRHLAMASTNAHKAKRDTSDLPRLLTQSESKSLQRDARESSAWMRTELKRRREASRQGKAAAL